MDLKRLKVAVLKALIAQEPEHITLKMEPGTEETDEESYLHRVQEVRINDTFDVDFLIIAIAKELEGEWKE